MSDQHQAFLRAIEQDFDSDTPRLVFADWLDEHGEPDRAAFIRLQCEIADLERRTPPVRMDAATKEQHARLTADADARLEAHRKAWTKGLPKWAAGERFERGFPNFYYITGKQLVDDGAKLRAVAPLGGYLSLRLLKGREAAVFASDHLAAVTTLRLDRCQLTDAGVEHLTASPHVGRVRWLDVGRGSSDPLEKDVNRLTDAAAHALAAADNLPALAKLDIGGFKKLTTAGVRALLESPRRAGLTRLDVSGGPGGPAFADLFRSPALRVTGLRNLNVGDRRLGDAGAAALAACPALAGLTDLHLYENDLTDAGALAVLNSPQMRQVRFLSLWRNPQVTDATARAILADGRPWERAELDGTGVSDELKAAVKARCEANG